MFKCYSKLKTKKKDIIYKIPLVLRKLNNNIIIW